MDRLDVLGLFVRVVESGSFSKAARATGVGQPAVSKQIAALEARLGSPLVTRSSRGLSVTAAGQDYYEFARRILVEIEEADAQVGRGQRAPAGVVRVAASPAFGRLYLVPRLAELAARHPGITLHLDVSERRADLVGEGVDVAVRMGRLGDSTLVARRIGTMRPVTVASRGYVAAHGTPRVPADLAGHNCLGYVFDGETLAWGFRGPDGPTTVEPRGTFRCNEGEALRAAVLAGLGIGHVASWLLAAELASGEVVRLLPDFAPDPFPIHALTPAGRRLPSRVRLMVDLLAEICAGEPELRTD